MWLATGHIGADLSKTISKKSLEIVLEAEILARSEVSGFWNSKTPKSLDFTGFSAFSTVFYFRLFCGNVGFIKKSWKPFAFTGAWVRISHPPPKSLENQAFSRVFFFFAYHYFCKDLCAFLSAVRENCENPHTPNSLTPQGLSDLDLDNCEKFFSFSLKIV